ncbi:hypothetical protein [Microcoleus sp. herbarium2]|uniref:hypothetical protein n=1 Tax=Microcoleus sp. herbarium2 TaxID=3055433 RepID=UPI002FD1965C
MVVSAQLSLFDTAAVVKPTYKIGDRVKLRKKPIAASYVKKGDIVEIAAVHPIDGSIEFWNERSECWEFIHPDEMGSILQSVSVNDSVTPVEVAVTESKPESAIDSVTPVEVAVTESNCQHSETKTIHLVDAVTESNCLHSENDSVTPVEVAVTESSTPESADYFSAVSVYTPRGTARGKKYYRLSYKSGGKVRHCHIRGGNTDSPIAQAKVQEVRSLLAAGVSPAEIARLLRDSSFKK